MYNGLPLVNDDVFTEREGVLRVAKEVNSARCIWRETVSMDVGIDGQMEHVNEGGQATGRMVFVQVKSGSSYFRGASADKVPYYPAAKHKGYWERSPLPVILVLHNDATDETYWVDARDSLRRGESVISVPKANQFNANCVRIILGLVGPLPATPMTMASLAAEAIARKSPSSGMPIDFLDLFLHGLMNLGNSVYFGVDLVMELAGAKLAHEQSEFGLGLGGIEYDFLRDYVIFLTAQDLVRVDFDEFNRDWDRGLVGQFMAPLTLRGREFCRFLSEIDRSVGIRAVQDKSFRGIEAFEIIRRVPVIEQLKTKLV
ncbi:DUF4365 domain-containing protein [Plantibacter sp. CFBP 8804]|uniref:DUF4365 domain-containing protein n=1 Tax=Plantibacter sp. CFBP 8804 TaxID=2775270 RepID=UPI00177EED6F|nr:DUF4365 domain-containing protein [Plantibacter sp. CFBP 8804]MBD8515767.1 DUF4365 domain-containing protein [Plantibacter sp. CFBP 8804]